MEYNEVFNRLDQKISNRIEDLQKQQDKLLERKKNLLDMKQKIHSFLSDAYQMKQLLEFNADLAKSVLDELNKIFQEEELNILENNQAEKIKIESSSELIDNQDLGSQILIDQEQEEPINSYKFVDYEGKDTSF